MPTSSSPAPRRPRDNADPENPPQVIAGKSDKLDDDFGDFNEEDFDDDFDDDFEEEMDDEYDLAEIEGEVEVAEVEDDDLADLPLDEKIGVELDEDGEPVVADPEAEEEEEFEEEGE